LRPRITLTRRSRAERNFSFIFSYAAFFNIFARKRFYFLLEWIRFGIGSSRPRVNFFSVCAPARPPDTALFVYPTSNISPFAWEYDIDVAAIWGLTMVRQEKEVVCLVSGLRGKRKKRLQLPPSPLARVQVTIAL
jgi:hypothetical protein